MFKKSLLIFGIITVLTMNVVMASTNELYDVQMNYYNSIKTCTKGDFQAPSISMFGHEIKFEYHVNGMINKKCEIKETQGNYTKLCQLPRDVAKKYADENIKTLDNGVENGVGYSSYVNEILNSDYCQTIK